jgi:hypothetical protein
MHPGTDFNLRCSSACRGVCLRCICHFFPTGHCLHSLGACIFHRRWSIIFLIFFSSLIYDVSGVGYVGSTHLLRHSRPWNRLLPGLLLVLMLENTAGLWQLLLCLFCTLQYVITRHHVVSKIHTVHLTSATAVTNLAGESIRSPQK